MQGYCWKRLYQKSLRRFFISAAAPYPLNAKTIFLGPLLLTMKIIARMPRPGIPAVPFSRMDIRAYHPVIPCTLYHPAGIHSYL